MKKTFWVLLSVMSVFYTGVASAEINSGNVALDKRLLISIGGFWPNINSEAELDSDTVVGPGTSIDFEDDLGFDDSDSLVFGSVRFRITDRSRIEFEFFQLDRDSGTTLSKGITWGDNVFAAGASVKSTFNTDIYRLSYGYSFIRDDKLEVGAAIGLHVAVLETKLEGTATIGGAAAAFSSEGADVAAPLPTLGLYTDYAVTSNFALSARVDYFALDTGDFDGQLISAGLGGHYQFSDSFGVAAGYRYFDVDVDVSADDWDGGVGFSFSGPVLTLTYAR